MSPEAPQTPVLSKAAMARLKAELEELTTEGRRVVSERLLRARELGDLSENAEYDQTKNDQGQMEARIRYLEWTIKSAIVQDKPVVTDVVAPGSVVTLRSLDEKEEEPEKYLLAVSKEERAKGMRTITTVSPLGQALMGRVVGDKISYDAPGGTFSFEVVAFKPWDGK